MLLFLHIFTSVKRPPHYKGQFCMALCDRYKEVSLYTRDSPQDLWADKVEQILDQLEEG